MLPMDLEAGDIARVVDAALILSIAVAVSLLHTLDTLTGNAKRLKNMNRTKAMTDTTVMDSALHADTD